MSIKNIRGRFFATISGSIFDISPNAKSKFLPVTPVLNPAIPRGVAHDFSVAGLFVAQLRLSIGSDDSPPIKPLRSLSDGTASSSSHS